MYRIERCPCCGGQPASRWHAVVAPFVSRWVLDEAPRVCELHECASCGHRYFDLRFTEAEIARLYRGYRGEQYYRARHSAEPWYTRAANDALGSASRRRERLAGFLGRHLEFPTVERVLDYGGDRGQYLPHGLGSERYVFELSDAPVVSGVSRIADEAALSTLRLDLVIAAHVLEHVSEPLAFVRRLSGLNARFWYYEVPLERPWIASSHASRAASHRLDWLRRHEHAMLGVDFVSTVLRVKLGAIPPGAVIKLHEHLSFFSTSSLRAVLEHAGLRVVALEIDRSTAGPVLRALAARPDANPSARYDAADGDAPSP